MIDADGGSRHYRNGLIGIVRKLPNLVGLFWRLAENGETFKKTK